MAGTWNLFSATMNNETPLITKHSAEFHIKFQTKEVDHALEQRI